MGLVTRTNGGKAPQSPAPVQAPPAEQPPVPMRPKLPITGVENTRDIENPFIRMFLYGDSGSGKTTIASSFPTPFFIVPMAEKSVVTLRGMDIPYKALNRAPRNAKGLVQGSVMDEMNRTIDELLRLQATNIDLLPETVVVESISHYCDMIVGELGMDGSAIMDQRRWGVLSNHILHVHDALSQLQSHVIYTALANRKLDGSQKVIWQGPMFPGTGADKLPAACDIYAYCEITTGKPNIFSMHTVKYDGYPARSRFKRMPSRMMDASWEEIKKYI